MIKVKHIVTPSSEQMEFVIEGMRNPYNSWEKSDSGRCGGLGHNDCELMLKLAKAGTDHRKFMRQMPVMMRITAPLYFWKEFDTYKVGTVSNSCSTMHKITEKEFTIDDFSCEHLSNEPHNREWIESAIVDEDVTSPHKVWMTPLDILRCTIEMLNVYRLQYLETKDRNDWWQMIQLLPSSYNQTRNITMNYEVLANIYASRKTHKLDEWVEFCKIIEIIPYFDVVKAACDKKEKVGDTYDENNQI